MAEGSIDEDNNNKGNMLGPVTVGQQILPNPTATITTTASPQQFTGHPVDNNNIDSNNLCAKLEDSDSDSGSSSNSSSSSTSSSSSNSGTSSLSSPAAHSTNQSSAMGIIDESLNTAHTLNNDNPDGGDESVALNQECLKSVAESIKKTAESCTNPMTHSNCSPLNLSISASAVTPRSSTQSNAGAGALAVSDSQRSPPSASTTANHYPPNHPHIASSQPVQMPQLILASGQLVQGIQGAQLLIPTSQGLATQTILTIPVNHVNSCDQMVNLALSNGQVVTTSLANLQTMAAQNTLLSNVNSGSNSLPHLLNGTTTCNSTTNTLLSHLSSPSQLLQPLAAVAAAAAQPLLNGTNQSFHSPHSMGVLSATSSIPTSNHSKSPPPLLVPPLLLTSRSSPTPTMTASTTTNNHIIDGRNMASRSTSPPSPALRLPPIISSCSTGSTTINGDLTITTASAPATTPKNSSSSHFSSNGTNQQQHMNISSSTNANNHHSPTNLSISPTDYHNNNNNINNVNNNNNSTSTTTTSGSSPTSDLLIDSPNQPTINQTSSNVVDGINLDEIKDFAKAFKLRRLSLGLTQTQVGQALSVTEGPAYSQSAICSALASQMIAAAQLSNQHQAMFEKLDITPKSAQKIKPVLERWMKEAEERFYNSRYKSGANHLTDFIGMEPSKKRKRRTSFTPQALELLNAHFERNTHPSGTEITGLAHQLGYEREVIRIWFCNKRQALKNTSHYCVNRKFTDNNYL